MSHVKEKNNSSAWDWADSCRTSFSDPSQRSDSFVWCAFFSFGLVFITQYNLSHDERISSGCKWQKYYKNVLFSSLWEKDEVIRSRANQHQYENNWLLPVQPNKWCTNASSFYISIKSMPGSCRQNKLFLLFMKFLTLHDPSYWRDPPTLLALWSQLSGVWPPFYTP